MAVAFKASLGSIGNGVSGTTISLSTGAAVDVGDLIVVRWAADNLSATTPTATLADAGGNTYTVAIQAARNATAAAGVAGGVLVARATTAMAFASNMTLTLSGAVAAKAFYAETFTGALATVRSTPASLGGASTVASSPASGTVAAGDLVIGAVAYETRGALTADTDTTGGSWSTMVTRWNLNSGSDASCVSAGGQYKITTDTSAQTYNVGGVSADWLAFVVVLQAALVPNTGTAATTYKSTVAASGTAPVVPNIGTAAVTYTSAVAASGTAPVPLPTGSRALEAGSARNTEDAVARVLESFVTSPPKTGTATVTYTETVIAAGRKAQSGASSPTYTETVVAVGKRIAKSPAATTYTEALAAVGKKVPKSTVATGYTETLVAVGKRTPKAAAVSAHNWGVVAQGAAPAGVNQGSALVTYHEAVVAVGKRVPKTTAAAVTYTDVTAAVGKRIPRTATVAVTYHDVVTAAGKRVARSAVTVTYLDVTAAVGKRTPKTSLVAVTDKWLLTAAGVAPVLLVGYFTVGMQYGNQPVVAWEMNGQGAPV